MSIRIFGGITINGSIKYRENNDPIIPNNSLSQNVDEGNLWTYTVVGSDPDLNPLTFSLLSAPAGATISPVDDTSAMISYTAPLGAAVETFQIQADDGFGGKSNILTVTLNVNEILPTVDPVTNLVADEGSQTTQQITATHPLATLTYAIQSGPGSVNGSGLYSYTPADGPATESVTVRISRSATTFVDVSFDVTTQNVSPQIALSGDSNVFKDAVYTVTLGAITDPGTDTVSNYRVNWGDGSFDDYASAGAKTHTYTVVGNRTITVDLTDEDGTHISAGALSITVDPTGVYRGTSGTAFAEVFNLSGGNSQTTLSFSGGYPVGYDGIITFYATGTASRSNSWWSGEQSGRDPGTGESISATYQCLGDETGFELAQWGYNSTSSWSSGTAYNGSFPAATIRVLGGANNGRVLQWGSGQGNPNTYGAGGAARSVSAGSDNVFIVNYSGAARHTNFTLSYSDNTSYSPNPVSSYGFNVINFSLTGGGNVTLYGNNSSSVSRLSWSGIPQGSSSGSRTANRGTSQSFSRTSSAHGAVLFVFNNTH